jgi:hypothetical protein
MDLVILNAIDFDEMIDFLAVVGVVTQSIEDLSEIDMG